MKRNIDKNKYDGYLVCKSLRGTKATKFLRV